MPLEWPRPSILPGRLRSQAIYVDTFGNVKLSALAEDLVAAIPDLRIGEALDVSVGDDGAGPGMTAPGSSVTWARTFGEVPIRSPLLTSDSYGRVTLAVHQGSAAATFGVGTDTVLAISRPSARRPGSDPPRRQNGPPPGGPMPGGPPRQAATRDLGAFVASG
jgi:S-adenosylmethionine hydrolase